MLNNTSFSDSLVNYKFLVLTVLVVSLSSIGVSDVYGAVTDQDLYTCTAPNDGSNQIHKINSTDGTVISSQAVVISGLPDLYRGCTGLAIDPTTDIFYMLTAYDNDGGNQGNRYLSTIDPSTGVGTAIGGMNDTFSTISFDNTGQLFGSSGNTGKLPDDLQTVNKTSGETTSVCTYATSGSFDMIGWSWTHTNMHYLRFDDTLGNYQTGILNTSTCAFSNIKNVSPYDISLLEVQSITWNDPDNAWWVIAGKNANQQLVTIQNNGNSALVDIWDSAESIRKGIEYTIFPNQIPVVTMVGSTPVTLEAGVDTYSELGATCVDPEDGVLTPYITGDVVNDTVTGVYNVVYGCNDLYPSNPASAIEVTRVVNVVDTNIPTIGLVGDTPFNQEFEVAYVEAGATCVDLGDGQIDGNVVVGGDVVDVDTLGTYNVTYDCDDSELNSAIQVTREVNVVLVDYIPPSLELIGDSFVTVLQHSTYIELGVVGIDNFDGDISDDVKITCAGSGSGSGTGGGTGQGSTCNLDTSIRGSVILKYNLKDEAGNKADTIERLVVVQKQSTGGGSSSSSSGTTSTSTGVSIPQLGDIPPVTNQVDEVSPITRTVEETGESISDLFANLFENRLNPSEPVEQTNSIFSSPQSSSSPTTSDRPSPIADFFSNLFSSFFR